MYHCTVCLMTMSGLLGRCPNPSCGAWGKIKKGAPGGKVAESAGIPLALHEIADPEINRIETGTMEFDRVLGGGMVQGSVILLAGAPGSGKSTLAGQTCMALADALEDPCKVMYVTAEETAEQSKPRLARIYPRVKEMMQAKNVMFKLLAEPDVNKVAVCVDDFDPDILIIDSIQRMQMASGANGEVKSGTVNILQDVTKYLVNMTRARNTVTIIIGHINKEGEVGGPMSLEHDVDVVLSFGDDGRSSEIRILRALKNRFGSTTEVGIFRMTADGMSSVNDPSEHLRRGRKGAPGSAVGCVMIRPGKGTGTRPMLIEVQALFGLPSKSPRRTITPQGSIEGARVNMILNVLEAHTELFGFTLPDKDKDLDDIMCVTGMDLFVNITGGFTSLELDVDLPLALAIASARLGLPIPTGMVAWGEIDLLGNVHPSTGEEPRVNVCDAMNFKKQIYSNEKSMLSLDDVLEPLYEAYEREQEKVKKREKAMKKARGKGTDEPPAVGLKESA